MLGRLTPTCRVRGLGQGCGRHGRHYCPTRQVRLRGAPGRVAYALGAVMARTATGTIAPRPRSLGARRRRTAPAPTRPGRPHRRARPPMSHARRDLRRARRPGSQRACPSCSTATTRTPATPVRLAVGRRPAADLPRGRRWTECATAGGRDRGGRRRRARPPDPRRRGGRRPAGWGCASSSRTRSIDCPPILVLTGRPQDAWLATWSQADLAVPHPLDPVALAEAVAELARAAAERGAEPCSGHRPPARASHLAGPASPRCSPAQDLARARPRGRWTRS